MDLRLIRPPLNFENQFGTSVECSLSPKLENYFLDLRLIHPPLNFENEFRTYVVFSLPLNFGYEFVVLRLIRLLPQTPPSPNSML